MFKKLIAAALGVVVLVSSASAAFAASSIDILHFPHQYYHHCDNDGYNNCFHYVDTSYIHLEARGDWGLVSAVQDKHKYNYKYISVTTYGWAPTYNKYYVIKSINRGGTGSYEISPEATIDGNVYKIVFNGQIYDGVAKSAGLLKKYLIAPIQDDYPLK